MDKPKLSKADDWSDVKNARRLQDNNQNLQHTVIEATKDVLAATLDLKNCGSLDAYAEVASNIKEMSNNAGSRVNEIAERAFEIVNEQAGKRDDASHFSDNAAHNKKVWSTVPQAAEDILSKRQAQAVKVSIETEEEHQNSIKNTSDTNLNELNNRTQESIKKTAEIKSYISNLLP